MQRQSTLVILFLSAALVPCSLCAETEGTVIPLWKNGAPGFEDRKDPEEAQSYWVKNVHNPSVTAFFPKKEQATGAAVIVCPGGGHRLLVFDAEGVQAARYLNKIGVAAFALKYRLGREEGSPYQIERHALADGQRAMRLVRSRAEEWGLDPSRLGIMGFSAGGEVVSMVAYADGKGDPDSEDPVERVSARPDFQILIYPGPLGIPETIKYGAPPAFLLVANDDFGAARSVMSLLPKLRSAGVPVETHLFARGGHAFNMGNRSTLKTLSTWPDRLHDWMNDNFILDATGKSEYEKELAQRRERMERFRQRLRERKRQNEAKGKDVQEAPKSDSRSQSQQRNR